MNNFLFVYSIFLINKIIKIGLINNLLFIKSIFLINKIIKIDRTRHLRLDRNDPTTFHHPYPVVSIRKIRKEMN